LRFTLRLTHFAQREKPAVTKTRSNKNPQQQKSRPRAAFLLSSEAVTQQPAY
jgi:hypothetical protein